MHTEKSKAWVNSRQWLLLAPEGPRSCSEEPERPTDILSEDTVVKEFAKCQPSLKQFFKKAGLMGRMILESGFVKLERKMAECFAREKQN